MEEERELLAQAKDGDREAFWELASPSVDPIYRLALRLMRSEEDAEDVLQETFLKALDRIQDFEGKSRFNTWLHRIAVNQGLMKLRKRRSDVFSVDAPTTGQNGEERSYELVDFSESALDGVVEGETRDVLEKALAELPIDLRTVVVMRDINHLSNAETAQALELPIGAVKWRLHRGRTLLRDRLSSYFQERVGSQGGGES
ncbi:MAG: sigma-70 family RNA polymerase sigma factor [Candidatus Eisenbacteria bacterium]|uniref:RNA polymerase sigma factor n=1 Tax=Eiseniibacteriota bacterium TaxID=2212470 RepID=A0A956M448_UNCEI|nr:sigma-70 family RNA polymerase sigma factor [Candidatus Eisenbacteria bacterium]